MTWHGRRWRMMVRPHSINLTKYVILWPGHCRQTDKHNGFPWLCKCPVTDDEANRRKVVFLFHHPPAALADALFTVDRPICADMPIGRRILTYTACCYQLVDVTSQLHSQSHSQGAFCQLRSIPEPDPDAHAEVRK